MVKEKLKELDDGSDGNQDVVKLKSYKKKALLFALPNLPAAIGNIYTISNVHKEIIYNSQLDAKTTSVLLLCCSVVL